MTVEEGANQIKDGASKAEILFILAVSVFLVMLAQYHWKRRRMYRMAAKIPGPPSYPIVGSGLMFIGSTESNFYIKFCNFGQGCCVEGSLTR